MVEGLDFQVWLMLGEDRGAWTCCLYQHGFTLMAGFDRGRSGRTILTTDGRLEANKSAPTSRPNPTRKPAATNKSTTSSKVETQMPAIKPEAGYEDIELQDMSKAHGSSETPAAEEGAGYEDIEMKEMSEVRRGKQRER